MRSGSSDQDAGVTTMTPIAPAAAAVATAPANTNTNPGVIVADNPIFDLPDVSAPAPPPASVAPVAAASVPGMAVVTESNTIVTSNPMFGLKGLSDSSSTSDDAML